MGAAMGWPEAPRRLLLLLLPLLMAQQGATGWRPKRAVLHGSGRGSSRWGLYQLHIGGYVIRRQMQLVEHCAAGSRVCYVGAQLAWSSAAHLWCCCCWPLPPLMLLLLL